MVDSLGPKIDRLVQYGKAVTRPLNAETKGEGGVKDLTGFDYTNKVASNMGHNILAAVRRIILSISAKKLLLDNPKVIAKIEKKITALETRLTTDKTLTVQDSSLIKSGLASMKAACMQLANNPKDEKALDIIRTEGKNLKTLVESKKTIAKRDVKIPEKKELKVEETRLANKTLIEQEAMTGQPKQGLGEVPERSADQILYYEVLSPPTDKSPEAGSALNNQGAGAKEAVEAKKFVEAKPRSVEEAYKTTSAAFTELLTQAGENPDFYLNLGKFLGEFSTDNQILAMFSKNGLQANPETAQEARDVINTIEKGLVQIGFADWKDKEDQAAGIKIDSEKNTSLSLVHDKAVDAYNDLCYTIVCKKTENTFKELIVAAKEKAPGFNLDEGLKGFVEGGFDLQLRTIDEPQEIIKLIEKALVKASLAQWTDERELSLTVYNEGLLHIYNKAIHAYDELSQLVNPENEEPIPTVSEAEGETVVEDQKLEAKPN